MERSVSTAGRRTDIPDPAGEADCIPTELALLHLDGTKRGALHLDCGSGQAATAWVGVLAHFAIVCWRGFCAVDACRNPEWINPFLMIFMIISSVLLADFISGVVHWGTEMLALKAKS